MQFVNPYNFIAAPKAPAMAYEDKDEHTGVIEYTITTKSPLFIPNTTSEQAFPDYKAKDPSKKHISYDFFSYNTLQSDVNYKNTLFDPVIPGSELRGMFRNIYETLTNSCMGVLNADLSPVKRTMEIFQSALIEKKSDGTYALWSAEDIILHIIAYKNRSGKNVYKKAYKDGSVLPFDEFSEGTLVYFKKRPRMSADGRRPIKADTNEVHLTKQSGDDAQGYLIRGESDGSLGKKTNCHIFQKKQLLTRIKITEQELEALSGVLDSYSSEPGQDEFYSKYKKAYAAFKKNSGQAFMPVYYSQVGNMLYLSPAAITKEHAHKSIGDLVGDLKPCTHKSKMCPACSLFGMTGKDNEQAVASKIRVTDANLEKGFSKNTCYDPIVTLQILGTPKISNSEFYLEQPEGAQFWTYDYKIVGGRAVTYDAEIRGRKFYWHQPNKKLPNDVERSDQNKTVRPVKTNITFIGKVYFERISQKQLDQLIWILNCGNPADQVGKGEIGYKLGGGKPLGLGSITCKVQSVTERKISLENGSLTYVMDSLPCQPEQYDTIDGFSKSVKKDFLIIHSLDAVSEEVVTYPATADQLVAIKAGKGLTEGYKWFTENHTLSQNKYSRSFMKLEETLPYISEISPFGEPLGQNASQNTSVKEENLEIGAEYTGTVKKIDGKTITFALEIGKYPKLKAGENGLENYTRKNIKTLLPENTTVVLKYEGLDSSDSSKMLWSFVKSI